MSNRAGSTRGIDRTFEKVRLGNQGSSKPSQTIVRELSLAIKPAPAKPVPQLPLVTVVPVPMDPLVPVRPPCPRTAVVRAVELPDCPKCGSWKTIEIFSPLDVLGHDDLGMQCRECYHRWFEED